MTLCNRLIYEDRLRRRNEKVANRALELEDRAFGRVEEITFAGDDKGCWLERLDDKSYRAVLVDTDALPAHDWRIDDLVQNMSEVELVRHFMQTLIQSGMRKSQYRHQPRSFEWNWSCQFSFRYFSPLAIDVMY